METEGFHHRGEGKAYPSYREKSGKGVKKASVSYGKAKSEYPIAEEGERRAQ